MSADWIKVRVGLRRHPKVVRIVSALKSDRLRVIGALMVVWSVFDEHSVDGRLDGYSFEQMDIEIGWPGFCEAMHGLGWLDRDGSCGIVMPGFQKHNGQSAKRRAKEAERKRGARSQDGGKSSASNADKKRTRVREEKDISSSTKKRERAPTKTPLCRWPEGFGVDEQIRRWNEEKGFPEGHLELHLEIFREAVNKGDLMYAGDRGWHAAFEKCIREDWGGLRSPRGRVTERQQVSFLDELTGKKGAGHVIESTAERSD
jgi:hypothetical protein